MSLAYFPLFVDDYEADTAHLSLLEDGIYNRLLRLCWRSPGCKIPSDEQWIFRRLRAVAEAEKEAVKMVLSEFFTRRDGKYFNKRLLAEYEAASASYERRKSAGSQGGKAKSLKSNNSKPSNATAFPTYPEPEPEPEPEATSVAAPAREASQDQDQTARERLLSAMGADPISGMIGPNGVTLGRQTDMQTAAGWADLGLTVDRQCQIVAERMAQARRKSPHFTPRSFAYFTGAMQDAVSARSAAGAAPQPQPSSDPLAAMYRKYGIA